MTLEKQNGAFTEASKADWKELTGALPDGCYTVTLSGCASPHGQIEAIVAWFNGIDDTRANDPALLDSLIVKSNELAFYRFRLSQELGALYEEKAGAEFRRKKGYFAELARLKKDAVAQKEKFVFSTAEILAENEISELRKDEFLADAIWQQTRLVYESAGDILQRMSQHISYLKSFRDAVLRSDNSNFPQ